MGRSYMKEKKRKKEIVLVRDWFTGNAFMIKGVSRKALTGGSSVSSTCFGILRSTCERATRKL